MNPSCQNTLLLLCSIPSFSDPTQAAEALRSLLIMHLSSSTAPSFILFPLHPSTPDQADKRFSEEYVTVTLSLSHILSMLSLLLSRVNYTFSTNLFKQMQRLAITQYPLTRLLS